MWSVEILVLLLCSKNVFTLKKEFCKPGDTECVTEAIKDHVFQKLVKGLPGVAPSDPLYLDKVDVDLPKLKYTLDHTTLIGMKDCDFQNIRLTPESASIGYELLCPKLIIKSEYELKGEIDEVVADGKGHCEITYDNYFMNVTGKYERVTREDGKLHMHVFDVFHVIDNDAQATTQFQNLSISGNGDEGQYATKLEEKTRQIVLTTILEAFMKNVHDFQRIVPIQDLHYRYV